MDIPVVITDRLTAIEIDIDGYRRRLAALELERDSLRLTVDVLTKIPDGWKYVEGGAEIKVTPEMIEAAAQQQTAADALPARPSARGGTFSVIERKIISTLRHLGPANRHLIADAVGIKPDVLSIRLTKMKAAHLVTHDMTKGLWSAA